jgi:hypothetical protein
MKERSFWLRILIAIWPTIRRVINDSLFFLKKIIRSFINIVLDEIR